MTIRRVHRAVLVAMSLGTGISACVLADKDITFEDEAIANRNAIRLVEATMLSTDAEKACDPNTEDMLPVPCPQPGNLTPADVLPHFLDPAYQIEGSDGPVNPYNYCTCSGGKVDINTLVATFYVEDQDEDQSRKREPRDKIYAALLLDLPPGEPEPYNYVNYLNFVDPNRPLDLSIPYKPRKRRDPHLRELVLGINSEGDDQRGLDLCNDARSPLAPGFHSLTVMVTDRAWFRPDEPPAASPQYGVPDLAVGATFDTMTYVFYCGSESEEGDPHGCADSCQLPPQENQ